MSTKLRSRRAFEPALFAAPYATRNVLPLTTFDGFEIELVRAAYLDMIAPIAGGAAGYNTEGDVLTQTADGRDLNDMWNEFRRVVDLRNASYAPLINFLTFPVTNNVEDIPQVTGGDFEEASEFGIPRGVRPNLTYFSLGFDFKWYDLGAYFTWKFLAEASAQQVEAVNQTALDADSRLVFKKVMNAIFRNTTRTAQIKGNNFNVYPLYNGDSTVPPEYGGVTFTAPHTHYLASGAAVIDSGDVEAAYEHLRHHGYSEVNGSTIIMLTNNTEVAEVRKFRFGVVNNNAAVAQYDFVPAQGSGSLPLIVPNQQGLLGVQPPSTFQGLKVAGQYGPVMVVENDLIPAGYFVMIASGGAGDVQNLVGIREHANAGLRGLRLFGGDKQGYPLINSFYQRGFGTGIRQRGGGVVMKITAGAYSIPTQYAS